MFNSELSINLNMQALLELRERKRMNFYVFNSHRDFFFSSFFFVQIMRCKFKNGKKYFVLNMNKC